MKIVSRKEAKERGEIYYYTGKPCKRGHIAERFVSSYACRMCAVMHHKKYRAIDPDFRKREAAYKAQYREKNKEKISAYNKKRWRTSAAARLDSIIWKHENRERIQKREREINATPEGKERRRKIRQKYYQNNRRARIAKAKESGARRRGAEGRFSPEDVDRIYKMQKGRCAGCRKILGESFHVDHIIPISKGGSNWPKNLQCMCAPCNLRKNAKHPIDWAQENGKLL